MEGQGTGFNTQTAASSSKKKELTLRFPVSSASPVGIEISYFDDEFGICDSLLDIFGLSLMLLVES
jgi:hypothetical protein